MNKTLQRLALAFLIPFLLGCGAGGETSTSGTTSVTVALGPLRDGAAPVPAGKYLVRAVPSGIPPIDNVRLVVTGGGMARVETVLPVTAGDPDPSVTLQISNGTRTFTAEAFGGGAVQFRGDNTVTLAGGAASVDIYVYPAWRPTRDDTGYGDPPSTPSARSLHTAVWTGSQMIVWGGLDYNSGNSMYTGARYDPIGDAWFPVLPANTGVLEDGLDSHTAVWTGTEMIVWGGMVGLGPVKNVGGRYNPATDSWQFTSMDGAPSARRGHTAVWTGSEMIVWGGDDTTIYGGGSSYFNDGARYIPATDTWLPLAPSVETPAYNGRSGHTAVWTGTEMIVWGGYSGEMGYYADGGRYNPDTNTWSGVSLTDAPSERRDHTAVWTGTEMIVWGGEYDPDGVTSLSDGARYTPASDSWSAMNSGDAPRERSRHTAVWTGTQMIVWGGEELRYGSNYGRYNDGGRYDPVRDAWTATSLYGAPSARYGHTTVWTATQMIVWGGDATDDGYSGGYVSTGGRYTPW